MTNTADSERRLAAIMFTDMVGYTVLGQKHEALSIGLVEEQRRLIRPMLQKHKGKEIKTMGDAFLVEFQSALDAVRCAYDIQRAIRELNFTLPEDRRVFLRVGVHLGDVIETKNDLQGDAVNIASRIEPLAAEGGVCLTRQVYDEIQNKFEIPLESLGPKKLKNVNSTVEVYKMMMPWDPEKVAPSDKLDRKRVAVLPFVNMTPDPNEDYFADGTTEELISTLSNISDLTVISRTSIMQYKGVRKGLAEIGKELRVGTILEGSVRRAGSHVRISAQLLDAAEDKHLWSQSYDRELLDVFAVQSDIAKSVAEALRIKLLGEEASKIRKKPTENTEAYLLYLKGRQLWNKRSKDGVSKAIEYFTRAKDLDPDFALAYSGLADCYITQGAYGYVRDADAMLMARPETSKALELDASLAEAHATNGLILRGYDWNLDAAEAEFVKAIELNPNYASAHQWYSEMLAMRRHLEDALAEIRRAMDLDPLSPIIILNVGIRLEFLERYDEAIEYFKRALLVEPSFVPALEQCARAYARKGEMDEATAWWEKWTLAVPDRVAEGRFGFAIGQAFAGNSDEALRLLDSVLALPDADRIAAYNIAWFYEILHDHHKALDWLEKSLTRHERAIMWIQIDPSFKALRKDPRFLEIVGKIWAGHSPPLNKQVVG